MNYYNTFFRKYDAQIGRFTGIDIVSEESIGLNPYHFGGNNPVMFIDPTGAKKEKRNPASFTDARDLWEYILENGINAFGGGGGSGSDFLFWSFSDAGGDGNNGGNTLAGFGYSNDFTVGTNRNGVKGIKIKWTGYYNDGKGGILNTVVIGNTFITAQNLWNAAMYYGENYRTATKNFFGEYSYDVMWQHNYNLYMARVRRGAALSQPGDRGSYTAGLAQFGNVNRAHVEGRMFELGFVGALAAPIALMYAPGIVSGTLSARLASGGSEALSQYLMNIPQYGMGGDNLANINISSIVGNFLMPNSSLGSAIAGNSFKINAAEGYSGIGSSSGSYILSNIALDYLGNRVGNVHANFLGDMIGNSSQTVFDVYYNLNK